MEQKPMSTNREKNYLIALRKAAETLRDMAPEMVAYKSATVYRPRCGGEGEWIVPFWGKEYIVAYPAITIHEAGVAGEPPITTQILILHYLVTADGHPPADRWVAFRELPSGLVYDAAFQGRAGQRIAATYGKDKDAFIAAAVSLGGERLTYGDASFMFRLFPRVSLAVVLYLADEEFAANANVLFDAAAAHYLGIEDLAVLGGLLASRLVGARHPTVTIS